MAIQTIRTTYALDVETAHALEDMARRWKVSKSEALRRAIKAAAEHGLPDAGRAAIAALDALQQAIGLDEARAGRWVASVRAQRRAAANRRQGRRK
jgi:hypothetical protein